MSDLQSTLPPTDGDLTLRSCATEVFRWVRSAASAIERSPALIQSVVHDLEQAWRDSAKR